MAWRDSQNSVCASLIDDDGLNSNHSFRPKSYNHMGPVDEDPRWQVFGPLYGHLQKAFPFVYAFLHVQINFLIRL